MSDLPQNLKEGLLIYRDENGVFHCNPVSKKEQQEDDSLILLGLVEMARIFLSETIQHQAQIGPSFNTRIVLEVIKKAATSHKHSS